MNKGLISVIMPAYNSEKYIKESIESVINQTYKNFELIIVNDGSNDGTKNIAEQYSRMDNRIKIINQKNQGVSVARNNGIHVSQGKYLCLLDADDLWESTFLEKMYSVITENPEKIEFAYCREKEIFEDHSEKLLGQNTISGYLEEYIYKNGEFRPSFQQCGSWMIAKRIIEKYNIYFPEQLKTGEDTCFLIKLLSVTKAYCYPEVLSYYMRRGNSATQINDKNPKIWVNGIQGYESAEHFVEEYRNEALNVFYNMYGYKTYRILLKYVRNNYMDEAIRLSKKYNRPLSVFCNGKGQLNDRIKCWILMHNDNFIVRKVMRYI